jgi:hypothetical protein
LEVLVRTRVFGLVVVAVVNDKTELAGGVAIGGSDGDIEIDAERIDSGKGNLARTPTVVHLGGVPTVQSPAGISAVRPIVVDAHVTGGNRVRTDHRLAVEYSSIARDDPALTVLSNLQILILTRIFELVIVAVVDEAPKLSVPVIATSLWHQELFSVEAFQV